MSVAGRRRFRVSLQDHCLVQKQERFGADWTDYRRVNSLAEASALVLELARLPEDETQELPAVSHQ